VLRAHPFSEWEISPVGDQVGSIPLGRPSTENWRIVCRMKGPEGLLAPEAVDAREPIKARFVGPAIEQTEPGGVVETFREVEVALPATREIGSHQAELVFRWPGGAKRTHPFRWRVAPLVRLTPPSVVIDSPAKPTDCVVELSADDRAFRIKRVYGSMLSEPVVLPPNSSRMHRLTLRVDPGRATKDHVSNIKIDIDHPDQPQLTLSVLCLESPPSS